MRERYACTPHGQRPNGISREKRRHFMHDADVRLAILNHEKAYWTALQKGNGDAAAKLTADGCVVVGARGFSTMGPEDIKPIAEQSVGLQMKFAMDESKAQVKLLSDDLAIVAYNVREDVVV